MDEIKFDEKGLVPAVVQDIDAGDINQKQALVVVE